MKRILILIVICLGFVATSKAQTPPVCTFAQVAFNSVNNTFEYHCPNTNVWSPATVQGTGGGGTTGGLGDPGANGIVLRVALDTTTTAAASDIVALFGGGCSISSFLRGDGTCASVATFTFPTAGVAVSAGTSGPWSPSLSFGTGPNALLQLDSSGRLPAVSAALLTNFPTLNQSTSGNAATATALAATPSLCTTGQAPTGILTNGNATGCAAIGGSSGLSGMVAGQIPVAATNSTVTSSVATTGSGNVVLATSPTLVTPNLGTPSAVNLANATNIGNASTASALQTTPTLCTSGQAPTGITANGNATGCAATGTNGTSKTFGGSPSNGYTFSVVSGTTYATNNQTGVIDYSGSDAAVVINSALGALATSGGTLFFKNGVYNFNSATQESNSGCTQFYSVGIPANPVTAWVQWHFEGESRTPWPGEILPASVLTGGVIFNVTASAITAAGSSFLFAVWQRPNNVGSSCTLASTTAPTPFSNELYFKNITVRFPSNSRGNEGGIVPWAASTVNYENVLADFNQTYTAIASGSAPSATSFGLASTYSGSGNLQHFKDTYVVGYGLCYDFESEHVVGDTVTAIYCNNSAEFGRQGGSIFHPVVITKFTDQENGAGFIFGPKMKQGSRVDLIGLDFEIGTDANWYSTARGIAAKFSESNPGYTSGIITYDVVEQNIGAAVLPAAGLFTAGGQNFQAFESATAPNIALIPVTDSFTRANSTATATTNGLGPAWANGTQASNTNLTIASNAVQVNQTGGSTGYSNYLAQGFNNDQFSKLTVATIDSSASTFFEVLTNMSTSPTVQTYYTYYCSHAAAGGSGIIKVIAGSATTLASQTGTVGCNVADTLELRHIGTTLWAYRNGVLDPNFTPNPVTDAFITGGAPGILIHDNATASATGTNWLGGSFPTMHGTDSIYTNDATFPHYNTATNCSATGTGASPSVASCGSASAGHFSCATNASGATCQVNTTAVTPNSEIFVFESDTTATGTSIGVTCNTSTTVIPTSRILASQTAGTGFVINLGTVTTNPACFSYNIVN